MRVKNKFTLKEEGLISLNPQGGCLCNQECASQYSLCSRKFQLQSPLICTSLPSLGIAVDRSLTKLPVAMLVRTSLCCVLHISRKIWCVCLALHWLRGWHQMELCNAGIPPSGPLGPCTELHTLRTTFWSTSMYSRCNVLPCLWSSCSFPALL